MFPHDMYTPPTPLEKLLPTPHRRPTPRPPNNRPHTRQRRIRQRRQLQPMSLLSSSTPQSPFVGRRMLFRALPVRALIHDEQTSISRDRDNHDRDRGFDLQPEIHPCGVDHAVDHAAGDAHDGDDHGEDAEGEGAAEDEFATEGDADAPEEGDGDGDHWGGGTCEEDGGRNGGRIAYREYR